MSQLSLVLLGVIVLVSTVHAMIYSPVYMIFTLFVLTLMILSKS